PFGLGITETRVTCADCHAIRREVGEDFVFVAVARREVRWRTCNLSELVYGRGGAAAVPGQPAEAAVANSVHVDHRPRGRARPRNSRGGRIGSQDGDELLTAITNRAKLQRGRDAAGAWCDEQHRAVPRHAQIVQRRLESTRVVGSATLNLAPAREGADEFL